PARAGRTISHDVGALAYPGRVTSGLWVPESEIERFVGSAALGRARGYANLDTLRDVHFEPGSRTLSARVQGTGSRAYRTEVTFGQRAAEGWSRPKLSTCTCPVGLRCQHAAALMLYAGSTPPRSAGRQPDWRRQLEQAVTGLRSGGPGREPPRRLGGRPAAGSGQPPPRADRGAGQGRPLEGGGRGVGPPALRGDRGPERGAGQLVPCDRRAGPEQAAGPRLAGPV